ncbi:nitric oxide synthase 3-like [Porites lutea]
MAVQEECPFSGQNGEFKMRDHGPKCLKLKNWVDGTEIVDTLHQKVKDPIHCTNGRCTGSIVFPYGGEIPVNRPYGIPRHKEEVKIHAKDFFEQYYSSINL